MTHDLSPYPAYKPSGVDWLGDVPAHWGVLPNRATFAEVNERNRPHADMLSVTINRGVIRQAELLTASSRKDGSNQDRSTYKLVRPGDIAYNKMRAWQGAVGASPYVGIVSPAYVVMRPRRGALPRYLHYLLRTPHFAKEAERWSYGITSDMWSLRPEHFKAIRSCLPPLPEQTAIVRYLDYIDRRVRRYLRAKQKLIALLEEQKQAIIQRAVTRGLDPDVSLKPSGVEWLGDVPAHWEVRRLKSSCSVNPTDSSLATMPADTEVSFLPMEAVGTSGSLDLSRNRRLSDVRQGFTHFADGDVLVAKITPCFENGKGALCVGLTNGLGFGSTEFHVIRPRSTIDGKFVLYLTKSSHFRELGAASMYGSAGQKRVPPSFVAEYRAPVPPVPEQTVIVRYLDDATRGIDRAIDAARRQIELLREYRTRLIADVVTGKVDVREVTARLPDEAEEPDLGDTGPTEDDESYEDAELELTATGEEPDP